MKVIDKVDQALYNGWLRIFLWLALAAGAWSGHLVSSWFFLLSIISALLIMYHFVMWEDPKAPTPQYKTKWVPVPDDWSILNREEQEWVVKQMRLAGYRYGYWSRNIGYIELKGDVKSQIMYSPEGPMCFFYVGEASEQDIVDVVIPKHTDVGKSLDVSAITGKPLPPKGGGGVGNIYAPNKRAPEPVYDDYPDHTKAVTLPKSLKCRICESATWDDLCDDCEHRIERWEVEDAEWDYRHSYRNDDGQTIRDIAIYGGHGWIVPWAIEFDEFDYRPFVHGHMRAHDSSGGTLEVEVWSDGDGMISVCYRGDELDRWVKYWKEESPRRFDPENGDTHIHKWNGLKNVSQSGLHLMVSSPKATRK